ncbi:DUF1016 N-terminal domain-containing protein [Candidatus Methylomirabilis limnetica]|uniref:DUF1016 N-terminal domain-containing protein n=1 Tax=Candidatus Methylomirabilis limnetica TaxID=2033718 RepID=UPI001EFDD124|nr:DUF1016 N-terminal domain-containing protein [Candidatus Methylomirabilis limnetica]
MKTKPASALYGRIREILESARASVARSVNTTQVVANWLVGREIVEEEQKGKAKAAYGERLLAELSSRLRAEYGNGYSVDNLELFRRFYGEYPALISDALPRKFSMPQISDALRRKSPPADLGALAFGGSEVRAAMRWRPGILHPNPSWTHYRPTEAELRAELRREVRALTAPKKHGDAQ